MDDALRATLIANAGVLFEFDGTKILLDAVYGPEGHPFSNLSGAVWQAMLNSTAPFEQIDYLLFTHAHPDHFSPEMTLQLLQRRRVKGIFMPDTRSVRASGLLEYLEREHMPAVLLSEKTDHAAYRVEPRITVSAFKTRHLDKAFGRVKHFCYLLDFGGKKVLITSDADYLSEDFARLGTEELRTVFVNPLFFNALHAGRFFHGELHTESVCVYHLPFRGEDSMHMRMRLHRDLLTWGADRPEAIVLEEPFAQAEF